MCCRCCVELRPHLSPETLVAIHEEGHPQGLRYLAAYEGERCVGVAGWRLVATTTAIRKLYVDDLVTRASERDRGIGRRLLDELVERAREASCSILDLDSGVQRADPHRFYMREGDDQRVPLRAATRLTTGAGGQP